MIFLRQIILKDRWLLRVTLDFVLPQIAQNTQISNEKTPLCFSLCNLWLLLQIIFNNSVQNQICTTDLLNHKEHLLFDFAQLPWMKAIQLANVRQVYIFRK
jgi:hypothetical protein